MGDAPDEDDVPLGAMLNSRAIPLGEGERGCCDAQREGAMENERRLWASGPRTMRHDWTLQSLMEGAAQSKAIKDYIEHAPACRQHPYQAAWYWKERCGACARVYAAMPRSLGNQRHKL